MQQVRGVVARAKGEPVSIEQLARDMIELSGLRPDVDIAIEEVGRRPGEKLHEDLFNPNELNRLGYTLLHKGRVADAIALWELNAQEYPSDWNVHDSLGDGYAAAGPDFAAKAIASFNRSLSSNPSNTHAREMIQRVQRGESFAF
jgi:tetratricopeptide (TPR) repeat protein